MNINHLIEFIYLAETLSFRRTADYFYVSRSVISRHLAALEEVVGVKLVDRGNQSVQLTEAGKVFYREAQTVLRTYANAVDRARAVGTTMGHTVRVGYLKNAARPVIVRFVRYMHHEHPDVHLELDCMEHGELLRAIDEGAVDIALAMNISPRISHNYRSTPIYTDQFFAVMSKDNPLAGRSGGVAFDELPVDKLLLPDSFAFSGLSELVNKLVKSNPSVTAHEYYRDVDMLYLKVQTEGYVAFSSSLNNAMFGDRLAIVPVTDIDSSFTVSAFYGDGFSGKAYEACKRGFESCQAAMKSWDAVRESNAAGISLASFD